MIITTDDPKLIKILSGVCLRMPDGSGYSTDAATEDQLRNLCTEVNKRDIDKRTMQIKPKYDDWSVSFADQPITGLRYADLLESLDADTEQAFLLFPRHIGADSEDLIYWLEEVYGQPVNQDNYGRVVQLFRFWYAATHPDEYHDPPGANPRFAVLSLYDTADKKTARTRKRRAQELAAFAARGWDSVSACNTAMKNGEVEIPWNPKAEKGE